MRILAIDTSSRACSAAVIADGILVGEFYQNSGLTHSRTLSPLVGSLLESLGLAAGEVDLFACSNGPGSFTGLRIGLSMTKGMAFAAGKPCCGVSTLLSLAYNALPAEGRLAAVLDARAGQVYAAFFELKDGVVTRLTEDGPLSLDGLSDGLVPGTMLAGDGAELVAGRFPGRGLRLLPEGKRLQRASSVALAALGLPPVCASELAPAYHRKPQAERELDEKNKSML